MRPIFLQLGATGTTDWTQVDYRRNAFGIGFRCAVGGHASPSLEYNVQHAFSSLNFDTEVLITRSTTTATLVFKSNVSGFNHGLAVGDGLIIVSAGAPLDGHYAVASVTNATTVTYTVANSGVTANTPGTKVLRLYVGTTPLNDTTDAQTTSQDGNYAFPPNYIRLNVSTHSAGTVTMIANQVQG